MLCEETVCAIKKSHLQQEYRNCPIPGGSHLQYEKNFVQCERRCTISEWPHLLQEERVFGLSIKSAVSRMSHLQYDERSMQHQESCIFSTSRRLCSVKFTVSESLICSRKTGCVV